MLNYNQEILLDSDTDRYGSYLATNYQFPFPENEVLSMYDLIRAEDNDMYQMLKKPQLILLNEWTR